MKCKRILSGMLAVLLTLTAPLQAAAVTNVQTGNEEIRVILNEDGTGTEPEEAQTGLQQEFRVGSINAYFAEKGEMEKIRVLYDEETEQVWIDGEEMAGYLNNYSYSYDSTEQVATIQVYNRTIAFALKSYIMAYAVGAQEGFYLLDSRMVSAAGRVWIPAEPFFCFLGSEVTAAAADLDTETWDPEQDFLIIEGPEYTVLDVLEDIFRMENGAWWMFTYEKDFHATEESLKALKFGAEISLDLYGLVTLDLERIFHIAATPAVDFVNDVKELANTLFGTELEESATVYDQMMMERFVAAMLNPTDEQTDAMEAEMKQEAGIATTVLTQAEKILSQLGEINFDQEWEHFAKLEEILPELGLEGRFDSMMDELEDLAYLSKMAENGAKVAEKAGTAMNLFLFGFQSAGIIQRMQNHDSTVKEAMELYLELSEYDTEIGGGARKALEDKYADVWNSYLYAGIEIMEEAWKNFGVDAALKAMDLSTVGAVTAASNVLWYAIENSDFYPMAKMEEPQAFQLSMYGIMYSADAWRELVNSYEPVLRNEGIWNYESLREYGLLALNYLKSCYVSIKAGQQAMASSEFAGSGSYEAAGDKMKKLEEMIQALTEALSEAEGSCKYGVYVDVVYGDTYDMTFEEFIHPSMQKSSYTGLVNEWDVPELTIYPLIQKEKELVNNGGSVVKYGDYVYYWSYQAENHRSSTLYPAFKPNISNPSNDILMRMGSDGTVVSISSHCSYDGEICILNDRLFVLDNLKTLYCYDLDGNPIQVYEEVSKILGLDEEGEYLIVRNWGSSDISAISAMDGSRIVLMEETSDYRHVILVENGKVYYWEYDQNMQCFHLYCSNTDGTDFRDICSVAYEAPYETIAPYVVCAQIVGEDLYLLAGQYQGSMTVFDGAVIYRVSLDENSYETLQEVGWSDVFFVKENEKKEPVLYYAEDGSYSMSWYDNNQCLDGPAAYQNLTTGETGTEDIPIAQMEVPFLTPTSCLAYLENYDQPVELVTQEALQEMGVPVLGEQEDGSFIFMNNVEILGEEVYFTLDYAREDERSSLGWRPGYARNYSRFCRCETGGSDIEIIYEY